MKDNNGKLLIGLVLGAVLGFLLYWISNVIPEWSENIALILCSTVVLLLFIFLLAVWMRQKFIKKFFGRNYQFETITEETHYLFKEIFKRLSIKENGGQEEVRKIYDFGPKLLNYLIWANLRNWVLKFIASFIIGLGGVVTTSLILNQNKLIQAQNDRIEQQTFLQEANRRSSQLFLLGDVLSDINKELNDINNTNDSLSNTLIGRITGLSHAMKPYRYIDGVKLIDKPMSPERSQLLQALLNSQIDEESLSRIYNGSDFSYSELSDNIYRIRFADFVNLSYSKLKDIEFSGPSMVSAKFNYSDLEGAKFIGCDLSFVKFKNTNLKKAWIIGSTTNSTDFTGAILDSVIIDKQLLKFFNNDYEGMKLIGIENFNNKYEIISVKLEDDDLRDKDTYMIRKK